MSFPPYLFQAALCTFTARRPPGWAQVANIDSLENGFPASSAAPDHLQLRYGDIDIDSDHETATATEANKDATTRGAE